MDADSGLTKNVSEYADAGEFSFLVRELTELFQSASVFCLAVLIYRPMKTKGGQHEAKSSKTQPTDAAPWMVLGCYQFLT